MASRGVDESTRIQLERNRFIVDKLYFNKPDDTDEKVQADVRSMAKAKYAIRVNDDDPL
jgi:hypothetical protein